MLFIIGRKRLLVKDFSKNRLRKFTFGNNGVEFHPRCADKYQAMICGFNIHLLGTRSKLIFLPGQTPAYFSCVLYNPQICELKYTIFLFCSDTLWLILSTYFPNSPCLFFSDWIICVLLKTSYSSPAAFCRSLF